MNKSYYVTLLCIIWLPTSNNSFAIKLVVILGIIFK